MLARKITMSLAAGTILALVTPALAKTIVVRPDTDTDTIQKAVNAAGAGDTIVLPRGVYDEDVQVDTNNLRFIGKRAIWESSRNNDCLSINATGVTITGIIFRHGDNNVDVNGDDFTATRCVFLRSYDDDNLDISGDRAVVDRCRFLGSYDAAIDISGADARITRNYIALSDEYGVEGSGDDAVVERNVILNTEDNEHPIYWEGDRTRVLRNRIANADEEAIELYGDDVLVDRNSVMACGAIYVEGDDFRITRNRCSYLVDDSHGINVDNDFESDPNGGGLIERNVIHDASENGIHASDVKGVRIIRNFIRQCGAEWEDGIYVEGQMIVVDGNRVFDAAGHGIAVWDSDSADNEILGNLVRGCLFDGIHVEGDDNEVSRNRVFNNHAQGLDNRGERTVCTNNVFLGNRIDVANDGTFVNFDGGRNRFRTGGEDTEPEIDFDE